MIARHLLLLSALTIGLGATSSFAADELPANHSLIDGKLESMHLAGKAASDGKSTIVDVSGAPGFDKALHIETSKREASDYELQYELKLSDVSLKKGEVVWAGVWARMLHTEDESGQGMLGLQVEQSKEPYDKLVSRRISVGPQWVQLACPALLHADMPAGSLHLTLRLGGAAQTLEIGGIQLVSFDHPESIDLSTLPQTRLTYGGREADAPWRAAAAERIEKIRKAPLTVHVVDAAGKPISGATVSVEMKQHAFPFGCVYDDKAIVGPDANSPANQEYARHFVDLFNVGVDENGMKWPGWEKPATHEMTMKALDWMTAHGIRVRGHNLIWPSWRRMPADVATLKDDPTKLSERIDTHIRDEVTALRGRLTEWDVINEPYVNNDVMKILGYGAMADWFKIAHEADPSIPLLLNETSVPTSPPGDQHYDVLYQQVQAIQKAGGPIGGVGMQSHFGSNLTSISDLQKVFERFAALKVPVEITELDIDVNDEQLQADYLRDYMTFCFSQPNIDGIMMWGFVESHHWRPDAALWTSNWKIKASGKVWMDLVKKQWWTNKSLTSGTDGSANVRGFLGDYTITVTQGGKTQTMRASLPKDGATVQVELK